jgi:type IV secretory pathway protease TraF
MKLTHVHRILIASVAFGFTATVPAAFVSYEGGLTAESAWQAAVGTYSIETLKALQSVARSRH